MEVWKTQDPYCNLMTSFHIRTLPSPDEKVCSGYELPDTLVIIDGFP